jgi:hypothetical protein
MTEKTAITISRQMGSEGTYIGFLAAKNLGFQVSGQGNTATGGQRDGIRTADAGKF